MKIYELKREQFLNLTLDEAWDFFSTPKNLDRITPAEMNFKIYGDIENKMYPGQIINYKIGLLPGIKVNWTTEITHVVEKKYFVDEQRFGPYKFWHHKHFLEPTEGGIIAKDLVHYGLPAGIFGIAAHAFYVKNQLKKIFDYRFQILEELFNKKN